MATYYGTSGNDVYSGTAAGDTIYGFSGADYLFGGDGADLIDGGDGNDVLCDNFGDLPDLYSGTLIGGGGNDIILGGFLDNIDGGSGIDTLIIRLDYATSGIVFNFTSLWSGATYTLAGATIQGMAKLQYCVGSAYGDILRTGTPVGETAEIRGLASSDQLTGGAGNDLVNGLDGDDVLIGGAGRNEFIGGIGADRFVFNNGDTSGTDWGTADRIFGFNSAQGDRIDLSGMDAIAGGGDDAFSFIGTAAFTGAAGQLRYDTAGVLYGDTNGDGLADFAIGFNSAISLSGGDFLL